MSVSPTKKHYCINQKYISLQIRRISADILIFSFKNIFWTSALKHVVKIPMFDMVRVDFYCYGVSV